MKNLGLAGITSHPDEVTNKYNRLLKIIGVENMLIECERFFDTNEIKDLILQIEERLNENSISLDDINK